MSTDQLEIHWHIRKISSYLDESYKATAHTEKVIGRYPFLYGANHDNADHAARQMAREDAPRVGTGFRLDRMGIGSWLLTTPGMMISYSAQRCTDEVCEVGR